MSKIVIEVSSFKINNQNIEIEGSVISPIKCLNPLQNNSEYKLYFGTDFSNNSFHEIEHTNVRTVLIEGKPSNLTLQAGKVFHNLKASLTLKGSSESDFKKIALDSHIYIQFN